jgi:hypothetical protein
MDVGIMAGTVLAEITTIALGFRIAADAVQPKRGDFWREMSG